MGIPIPPETPDPNIDDPTLPPPDPIIIPDQDPTPPGIQPPVGDPASEEPPVKA